MRWLHRLLHHGHELLAYLVQFDFTAQGGAKSGERPGGGVLSAVEAAINDALAYRYWLAL